MIWSPESRAEQRELYHPQGMPFWNSVPCIVASPRQKLNAAVRTIDNTAHTADVGGGRGGAAALQMQIAVTYPVNI